MKANAPGRSPALDLIRCIALFCVAGIHFFLWTDYYQTVVDGPRMYAMTFLRSAMCVCVPLFLLLTGWLNRNRRPEKAYFAKLIHVLGLYLLASMAGSVYRFIWEGEPLTLYNFLTRTLKYIGSQYGWYIEMYIGLFLLSPYINIVYDALATRRQRRNLIGILLLLTALPGIVNVYNFTTPGWWQTPSVSTAHVQLIPKWWADLYPLTYYLLGCYLRDYPLKLSAGKHLALTGASFFLFGAYCCWRSAGACFLSGGWQENGALLVLVQSVLLFSFLAQRRYDRFSPGLCRVLARISSLSLGAYLVSWMFDYRVYAILNAHVPDVQLRLNWFPVTVGAVLIGSLALSAVLNGLWDLICKAVSLVPTPARRH